MARDLRFFYLFRLLATSYLWVPIFVPFMFSRGLTFRDIMILGGIYSAVVIIVEVPTGAFADRIGRRTSMMLGALIMAGSCLIAYQATTFSEFLVSEAMAAVSMSLCSGADSAYLFDLLAENGVAHEYGRRESTASAWHQAGSAIAFAGGGLLAEIDLALPYLVTAGVALCALAAAFTLGDDRSRLAAPAPLRISLVLEWRSWASHMKGAMGDVMRNGRLAWIIGYSAVVFVLLRATIYLYQPYLNARSFSYSEIGFVFAAVYLTASFVAHRGHMLRQRFGDEPLLWTLLGGLAISFVLLEEMGGPFVLALLAVQAVANGLYSPLVKPLLNKEITDSSRRATVLSVESIFRRGAMGLFAPIAGFYGASSAMTLCGIIGLVGLVILAAFAIRRPAAWRGAPTID
ncbi:MAG: MFS transporter [Deltaproteobacteria bacterium]|nr:MFS transporter [Kofleriaceae bacterium]